MRQRLRSWFLLLVGLAAMGLALRSFIARSHPPVHRMTLTAGALGTTRALVGRMIVDAVTARGNKAQLVETSKTEDEFAQVDAGIIDFALVSEAYRVGRRTHVREVTPLYVEALHLLVKQEFADAVDQNLGALRGRTVDLGPPGSASVLAAAVLGFAGVVAGDAARGEGYTAHNLEVGALEGLIAAGDRTALPAAIMNLATVPSKIALQLIRGSGYRLVALPFAEAFRLNTLIAGDAPEGTALRVERQHVTATEIPAFTYQAEPAIPAESLPTIGARLMLVANERVPPAAVESVLETVFHAPIATIAHPPLDRGLLALPPHLQRHEGTREYLRRDQQFITHDTVDTLSSSFSVLGALAGGMLFLWQWWRQRTQASRDERFGSYLLRMAEIERRVTALELAATLELEPLVDLQREVLTLKNDALERFAAGELGGQAALSDLLMPLNAARDHIGDLILHVRGTLEDQAQAEGRSATALWTDAIDQPEKPDGDGEKCGVE